MMPHDTPAKARPSRELREERARAFWQAQINEGRARAAEQQAKTNTPAAPRQDPPPSPPPGARSSARRICRYDIYRHHAADQSPRYTGSLSGGDICPPPHQCRHRQTAAASRAAPQAKDRAAWRLVQTAVPSLTDKAAQDGDRLLVAHQGSRNPVLSRSCRSAALSRVVCDTPRRACGSLLIHFRTVAHLARHPLSILLLHAIGAPMFLLLYP